MSDFLDRMKAAAKADKKTIVLPEGEDPRTIEAAKKIVEEGLANLIILGDPAEIDVPGATVINPRTAERKEDYAVKFAELRAKKGVTLPEAAFVIMCTKTPEYGENGTLLFADCGLNINPTADELSEIAIASADSWRAFMPGADPKVAMLSFSTMGSAKGDVPAKVQEAVQLANEKAPELALDGDLQLDAALVKSVAELKAPHSSVAGNANILVFPDLESGNIGYKLVQRFAGAEAYGPVLQGIAKPVNDLSRGCSADDIVGVVAITAVQAQMAE